MRDIQASADRSGVGKLRTRRKPEINAYKYLFVMVIIVFNIVLFIFDVTVMKNYNICVGR